MSWKQALALPRNDGADGLQAAADLLLAESTKVAPIEHDVLIQSAGTDLDRSVPEASVFYDTPYAVIQHENLRERHDPGREGKYLERPLHEQERRLIGLIADHLRHGLHS